MLKLPKLSIGNIKLKNCLMLAPMAGITDLPLRQLAVDGGAGLVQPWSTVIKKHINY